MLHTEDVGLCCIQRRVPAFCRFAIDEKICTIPKTFRKLSQISYVSQLPNIFRNFHKLHNFPWIFINFNKRASKMWIILFYAKGSLLCELEKEMQHCNGIEDSRNFRVPEERKGTADRIWIIDEAFFPSGLQKRTQAAVYITETAFSSSHNPNLVCTRVPCKQDFQGLLERISRKC